MGGHCQPYHNPDGSIKKGLPSLTPNTPLPQKVAQQVGISTTSFALNSSTSHRNGQSPVSNVTPTASNNGKMSFTGGLTPAHAAPSSSRKDPHLDDGPSYSAMGVVDLRLLSGLKRIDVGRLETETEAIENHNWRQYGNGDHRQLVVEF